MVAMRPCEWITLVISTAPFFSHSLYYFQLHMLKLARNALADLDVIVLDGTHRIECRYICMLHEIQLKGVKFTNKLSDRQINSHRLKMKVNIVGRTLSSSVTDVKECRRQLALHLLTRNGSPYIVRPVISTYVLTFLI